MSADPGPRVPTFANDGLGDPIPVQLMPAPECDDLRYEPCESCGRLIAVAVAHGDDAQVRAWIDARVWFAADESCWYVEHTFNRCKQGRLTEVIEP